MRTGFGLFPARVYIIGIVLATLMMPATSALAARTDVVVISNGDHFTGEVKSLDRGRLRLKTDNAGDVYIEWDKIRSVNAAGQFDIETRSGRHRRGFLRNAQENGKLLVVVDSDSTVLGFESVVRVTPLKNTFWGKVDGSFDVGSSFALANHLAQLNLAVNATYREQKYLVGTGANSTVIHQDNVPDTRRGTLDFTYKYLFENRWQGLSQTRAERNDQLGLDMRLSTDAGIGRYLMQSNSTLLDAGAGLSVNREERSDGTSTYNLEGLVSSSYSTFVYDSPKVNVDMYLHVYPSLSNWGRVRLEASAVAKRELVKDLFIGLNGVESFDNQPPVGATNTDWNVYLSVGWTF